MATATGLTMIKEFEYRDDTNERWSNKYWFTGTVPANDTEWRALFDQLAVQEKTLYAPTTTIVGGYGYNDTAADANSVWTVDLEILGETVPGTLLNTQGNPCAGDQAGLIQWRTSRKSSRGKWIYLRKFMHGGFVNSTDPDRISPAAITAYTAFATLLGGGSFAGGRVIRSAAQDEALIGQVISPWVTTRTLKRRGKRP